MHSHSFQDKKLNLHRYVNDSMGQIVDGLTILWFSRGLGNKGLSLKTRKFNMHLHSFQDTELKLHRYVNDSPGQVVKGMTILRYPRGSGIKG